MVSRMQGHNRHVIRHQTLELEVSSGRRVHETLQSVAQRLRLHIMPDIEMLFDRFSGPDYRIKLDRVELDLGDLPDSDWQGQLASRLVGKLTGLLEQATIYDPEHSSTSASSPDDFRAFIYFLHHGRLPAGAVVDHDTWLQQLLQTTNEAEWQLLRDELIKNEYMSKRFIYTLDDAMLAKIIEQLYGLRAVLPLFECWFPVGHLTMKRPEWRLEFWRALLHPVSGADETECGMLLMGRLLKLRTKYTSASVDFPAGAEFSSRLPAPWCDWFDKAQHASPQATSKGSQDNSHRQLTLDSDKSDQSAEKISQARHAQRKVTTSSRHQSASNSGSEGRHTTAESKNTNAENNSQLHLAYSSSTANKSDNPNDLAESIAVNGAGGVILHPFLEELFRRFDLLAGREFHDDASRERAVHLLRYLTFAETAMPEYELLVPKLLCGMAWEVPLSSIVLDQQEQFACDELLNAVLGHWRALKGCSVNWLREQFFLRPAALQRVDEGWRLTVERRAQDVLLDRLPWGLGVIVLPWRNGLLYVNWTQ